MNAHAHPWEHRTHHPDKPAIIMADSGECLTYGEMMRHADQAAQLFAGLGCQGGDTIALLSENNVTYPEICWAAKNSGLYYGCVSNQLNLDDAAYVVDNCDAKILLASAATAPLAAQITERLRHKTLRILIFGEEGQPKSGSYEFLRNQQSAALPVDSIRGASLLYSSGTTGRPKGVRTALIDVPPTTAPMRHRYMLENYGFSRDTVFIDPGPFYHAAPLRMMMSVHREGGTVIGFRKFDADAVLHAIEKYSGTHGFFVPTMFSRFLQLPAATRARVNVSSMRYAIHGAAPCTVGVKDAMMSWWGPVLYELYGGTEGFGHTFITPQEWLRKKGSVGAAAAGCEIRIFDDQNRPLGPNQIGRIYMGNGRRFEYYKDEQKTLEAHNAEGLATFGDIGYLDEDGYLFLTDRHAFMIIAGGVNIYPQEAENVLSTHPAIADVAVIGVPNTDFGEEVKAVVQLKEPPADAAALAADILQFCRARLSAYKCPRSVDFVSELPRSDAGKLLKRVIKAPYWQGHSTLIS
jgi:acyl-CoA synthetase (AMP-forming)/AMP-acid ligase II